MEVSTWPGLGPSLQDFPQCVDGRAIHIPLSHTHLAQVGARMARQALSVLKELTTELAPDITNWLCPRGCKESEGEGGRRKEALSMGRKQPPSSRPKSVPDFWMSLFVWPLPPDSNELHLGLQRHTLSYPSSSSVSCYL